VSSLLNKYKDDITPEKLADIDSSIIAISTVHRQLYKGSDLENISFQPVAEHIAQSLLLQRGLDSEVLVNIDAHVTVPQKKSTTLALMFNELFTNSLKYAFRNTSTKKISLTASTDGEGLLIIYRDNGKGYDTDFLKEKTSGFGRILLEGLAHQLRAKINFYNEGGACCMIKL
jgi:two-component sensor histidine kinase